MTKTEMAQLLTYVHSAQGGEPTQLEVEAWHDIIGDMDYHAAMEAARECLRGSPERLKPAHVAARSRAIRNDRYDRQLTPGGGVSAPRPANYTEMVEAARRATHAARAVGFGWGDEETKRSAFAAADLVRTEGVES